jgi:hypothetical protein
MISTSAAKTSSTNSPSFVVVSSGLVPGCPHAFRRYPDGESLDPFDLAPLALYQGGRPGIVRSPSRAAQFCLAGCANRQVFKGNRAFTGECIHGRQTLILFVQPGQERATEDE